MSMSFFTYNYNCGDYSDDSHSGCNNRDYPVNRELCTLYFMIVSYTKRTKISIEIKTSFESNKVQGKRQIRKNLSQ